jgi:hypothetical protein
MSKKEKKLQADWSELTRLDMLQIRQMLKNPNYQIPQTLRDKIPELLEKIVNNPEACTRDKLAASKTTLSIDIHEFERQKALLEIGKSVSKVTIEGIKAPMTIVFDVPEDIV